jgi:Putative transposase
MAELLFDAAQSTIRKLVGDSRWCGGLPGVLMALHTWSRQLLLHPHVHALVTEGGLGSDGAWRLPKKSILVPTEVLRAVFKGKFQQRLELRIRSGRLRLPRELDRCRALKLMKRAGEQEWIVDRRGRYDHGVGVATYLARYMRGGPLRNHQLIDAGPGRCGFAISAPRAVTAGVLS